MPDTECRIVDPERGASSAPGEPGEVWVRGPQVMKGYLNNPEATARTVDADGWLHTGDIGVVDDDGYLEVVDRLKELIKVKGYQVAPAELEALLLKHPQIADAAVIPVADEEAGEVPKAFVVRREPLTADEVMDFVAAHVAHYKRMRHVAFIDAIPKSPSGKILRRARRAGARGVRPSWLRDRRWLMGRRGQKRKRTWNWNIRGGSMLASAGSALAAVPAATTWPNVGFTVAVSP